MSGPSEKIASTAASAGFSVRRPKQLLTIAHSYVVALNRRLAHEMAVAGRGRWEVTAVAPDFFHGDLRPIHLETFENEECHLEGVPTYFSRKVHVMLYGTKLRRLLRQKPWDLVHCWEEPYTFPGAQVARWTPRGVPYVFSTLQNIPKRYPPPFNLLEKYCVNRSSGWLACGHSVVETLVKRGYDKKPHRIMPLGLDPSRFRVIPEARAIVLRKFGWDESGPPIVGYQGRFVPEKGLAMLMRVLDQVPVPWRALFLGGGPMDAELRAWAAKYPGRVVIASAVPHEEVPAYINAMDLLAAPSETRSFWREQFGRMLTEAFACGVPVVASSSGEIPYVVADAGKIVPEADEPAWLAALTEVISSPDLRAEYRRRGLDRVATHYTWDIVARGHIDFFDEILDSAPARK